MKKFLSILAFVNLIFANFTFANTDNNETCGCGEGLKSQEEINKFFGLKSKNSAENPGKNSNTNSAENPGKNPGKNSNTKKP